MAHPLRDLRAPRWAVALVLAQTLFACRSREEPRPSAASLLVSASEKQASGDRRGAERDLRSALAIATDARAAEADRRLEVGVRGTLAALLMQTHRDDEARAVAAPACARGANGQSPPQLVITGLCPR